ANSPAATTAPTPPPAPEQAEQNSPNVAPPAAELQPSAPPIPDADLALLRRAQPLAGPASQTQETGQETGQATGQEMEQTGSPESKPETRQETTEQTASGTSETPVAESTVSTEEQGAVGKSNVLQILLLALFCVPALYLAVVGMIRHLARARRRRHSYYASLLHAAPAEPRLLPPPLESNNSAITS
ncbi:MAG: hypothetical protein WCB02_24210, partial [Bradyrhizobium sp.]